MPYRPFGICFWFLFLSAVSGHAQNSGLEQVLVTLENNRFREIHGPVWAEDDRIDTVQDRILQFYLAPQNDWIYYVTEAGLLRRDSDAANRTMIVPDMPVPRQLLIDEAHDTLFWLTDTDLFTADLAGGSPTALFPNPGVASVDYLPGHGFYYSIGGTLFLRAMDNLAEATSVFQNSRTIAHFDVQSDGDTLFIMFTDNRSSIFQYTLSGATPSRITDAAPQTLFHLNPDETALVFPSLRTLYRLPLQDGDVTLEHRLNTTPTWAAYDLAENRQWFLLDDRLVYQVPFNHNNQSGARAWTMGLHYDPARTSFVNGRVVTYDVDRRSWIVADFPTLDWQPFEPATGLPEGDGTLRFNHDGRLMVWFDPERILTFDGAGTLLETLPVDPAEGLTDVTIGNPADTLFITRETTSGTDLVTTDFSGGNLQIQFQSPDHALRWWPDPANNRHYVANGTRLEAYDGSFKQVANWDIGIGELHHDPDNDRFFLVEARAWFCDTYNHLWSLTPHGDQLHRFSQGRFQGDPLARFHWDESRQTLIGFDHQGYAFARFPLQQPTRSPAPDLTTTALNAAIDSQSRRIYWMEPTQDGILASAWPPDGNPPERVVAGLFSPGKVVVVPESDSLVYHDAFNRTLVVSGTDGSNPRILWTLRETDTLVDFAIDAAGGNLFWITQRGVFRVSTVDPEDWQTILTTNQQFHEPDLRDASLAFNPHDGRVYLGYIPEKATVEGNMHQLISMSPVGEDRQTLVTQEQVYSALQVDPATNRVYWINELDYCPHRTSFDRRGTQVYSLAPAGGEPALLFDFPETDVFQGLAVWQRLIPRLSARLRCWGRREAGLVPATVLDLVACLNGVCSGDSDCESTQNDVAKTVRR